MRDKSPVIRSPEARSAFNYHDTDQAQDPYAETRRLREVCPVAHSNALFDGYYFATTYDGVKAIFADYRDFTSTDGASPDLPMRLLPVDFDPPRHTIWRRIMNRYFTAEAAESDAPRIQGIADRLVDSFIEQGLADGANDFARPLLTETMIPIIGVPLERASTLNKLLSALASTRESDRQTWEVTFAEVVAMLMSVIAERRSDNSGKDDLLQCLLDNQFEGRFLSDEEVYQTLLPTLFGAMDSTSSVISQAIFHLARHPADKERLCSGEVSWKDAVEEFIRIAAPIQAVRRVSAHDVELNGTAIAKGCSVIAMPGAANRDPSRFIEPDTCQIGRDASDHLSFGAGGHVCIGRHFARVLVEIGLRTMLVRAPDFTTPGDFVPSYTAGEVRGITDLPIRFTPGGSRP